MPSSDALVVVNDWISEFYFTADERSGTFLGATRDAVKQWNGEAQDTGLPSPLDRFTANRQAVLSSLIALHETLAQVGDSAAADRRRDALAVPSTEFAEQLRAVLGYDAAPHRGDGALRWYTPLNTDEPAVAVIDAVASETAEDLLSKGGGLLTRDVILQHGEDDEGGEPISTVSRLLSALISLNRPPKYLLIIAGRTVVLTSEDGWPQGRYLTADVQTIADRGDTKSGGEIQRMLACLSAWSVAPDPNGIIWWDQRREESVRNAVGVSQDLRDGVRESIEILANEVVARRRAQGMPPLADACAQELAVQCLRYLYRILFLLYAEASPELGVLPTGDPDYESGYSVDRLRELTLKQLTSASEHGTHLYESLRVLFDLVEKGHEPKHSGEQGERAGLTVEALRSDLFRPSRTCLIDQVKLGNKALQRVLQNLLLTKERRGRDRGFISYVALGINQLGAVYESLMSYTGSFATGTLVEVARHGDPSHGSWVVPEDRIDEELAEHEVMVEDELGQPHRHTYQHGEFVFRLSGRQRQQSASYYSPKVLTEFTVQQGLEELITEETTAEDILGMSVCEPALGSGAFAIEAVRQLAELYLSRRQEELGQRIEGEDYQAELQKVKAYLALHNVYGVDLNPTAVELAEVSLWMETITPGLKAPWFGLRLRSGNSLVGARHAVYDAAVLQKATPKARMATAPRPVPLERSADVAGVFHFLLPASGWGAAGSNSEIKKVAPEQAKQLRDWARRVSKKPTKTELKELQSLTERMDYLWDLATRRMVEAEKQSRRSVAVWGTTVEPGGTVTREQIEASLQDSNSAYRRLRLVMDAWCALWFWPVTLDEEQPAPPEWDEWLAVLRRIVGQSFSGRKGKQEEYFAQGDTEWNTLEQIENMFPGENAVNIDRLLQETPWLREAQRIAKEQRFFHWELDFAAVFARGGFDFQTGNPPWVRPRPDVAALLGESDPWWTLTHKPSEAAKKKRREWTMSLPDASETLLLGLADTAALAEYVGALSEYPELKGTQPDLYRAFMVQTWRHASERGHSALIHPPSHLTDARGYVLRRHTYQRLRRHWNFINDMKLFAEIDNHVSYSVNIYGAARSPAFKNAVSMYHPLVAAGSLSHNGDGIEPGFKNDEGKWDLRPHRSRIESVNEGVLETWHRLMESGTADIPTDETRMVYAVNQSAGHVLAQLARLPTLRNKEPQFSRGWDETFGRRDGYFKTHWGKACSWDEVILQGPYFHLNVPFYASRNESLGGNRDYTPVDLETLAPDALPVTEYKPIYDHDVDGSVSTERYDRDYGSWTVPDPYHPGETRKTRVRSHFRVMWRAMAATTGERTLIPAVFPPGAATVDAVSCHGYPAAGLQTTALAAASMSSLLADFLIRSTVNKHIRAPEAARVPQISVDHPLAVPAILRILRLNCLTNAYAGLRQSREGRGSGC